MGKTQKFKWRLFWEKFTHGSMTSWRGMRRPFWMSVEVTKYGSLPNKGLKEGYYKSYKVLLTDHLYPMIEHFYPDGSGLFQHGPPTSTEYEYWMIWWRWKLYKSYAVVFALVKCQPTTSPVRDFFSPLPSLGEGTFGSEWCSFLKNRSIDL